MATLKNPKAKLPSKRRPKAGVSKKEINSGSPTAMPPYDPMQGAADHMASAVMDKHPMIQNFKKQIAGAAKQAGRSLLRQGMPTKVRAYKS